MKDQNFETVEHAVYRLLRDEIISLALEPGCRLQIEALAERIGVSQTPIRQTLRRLESEGLVESIPRRGSRVALLTADEVEEIQLIRLGVEPSLARIGCTRLSEDRIAEMEQSLGAVRDAYSRGDLDGYLALQGSYRDLCYLCADRPRLYRVSVEQRRRFERYLRFLCTSVGALSESLHHQDELLCAVRAHDEHAAEASVRGALNWSLEQLQTLLADHQPSAMVAAL